MRKRNRFGKVHLFGLNVQTVNMILDDLQDKQNSDIEQISEQIQELKSENSYLRNRIEDLKLERQTELKSKHILEYSLKKAEDYVKFFYNAAGQEVDELTFIGEKTEALFNEKIEEFDITIKETRLALDMLLKEVLSRNDKLSEKLGNFMKKNGSIRFLTLDEEKKVKKNDSGILPSTSIKIEEHPFKKESQNDFKHGDNFLKEKDIKSVFNIEIKETEADLLDGTEFLESSVRKFQEEKRNNKDQVEKMETNKGVSNEINNLRNKYLIGKMAGADILDKNGQTLISKNTLITEEIVDKVESEGKLAELIVNMTIPEAKL